MVDPTVKVHETAVVDPGAEIGARTRIWHWVHISSGAVIGPDCVLGQNAFVSSRGRVGKGVRIQNNVSVYDDVTLEDYVFCGPSVVFTNVMNPRSEVSRKDEYLQTVIKKGATLGANATIVCGVEIGEYAFVGAGTVVLENIPSFALVVGNPARQVGWMSAYGERLNLPVGAGHTDSRVLCPHTGDEYRYHQGKVERVGVHRFKEPIQEA